MGKYFPKHWNVHAQSHVINVLHNPQFTHKTLTYKILIKMTEFKAKPMKMLKDPGPGRRAGQDVNAGEEAREGKLSPD